jgi:hypothetical protein
VFEGVGVRVEVNVDCPEREGAEERVGRKDKEGEVVAKPESEQFIE